MQESIKALKEYGKLLNHYRTHSIICGATGVVRRALNSKDFLDTIYEKTGIEASLISEESEAFLSARGVLSVLPKPRSPVLIFDLGGSSTEFLLADPNHSHPILSTSIFMGAATITERYLPGDPPDNKSIAHAINTIRETLEPNLKTFKNRLNEINYPLGKRLQLVGTAGTVTTLAAMYLRMDHYQPYRVNGLELTEEWLTDLADHLARLPLKLRRNLSGLEAGREDIILGGALIVREILRNLEESSFTVTDAGLLEGLLMSAIEKESGEGGTLWTHLTWHQS
jgi:exopolyphosphatase/guanosine-5'-triphosphate,3'-diphosphate pyrophosphatase